MRTAGTFEAETLPPHSYHQDHPMLAPAEAVRWNSAVPIYLFGGLAAMLGLIAFALLILACSYWRLSGYLDSAAAAGESAGDGKAIDDGEMGNGEEAVLNSVLVIMAGGQTPTFLATAAPVSVITSEVVGSSSGGAGDDGGDGEERREKVVEMS